MKLTLHKESLFNFLKKNEIKIKKDYIILFAYYTKIYQGLVIFPTLESLKKLRTFKAHNDFIKLFIAIKPNLDLILDSYGLEKNNRNYNCLFKIVVHNLIFKLNRNNTIEIYLKNDYNLNNLTLLILSPFIEILNAKSFTFTYKDNILSINHPLQRCFTQDKWKEIFAEFFVFYVGNFYEIYTGKFSEKLEDNNFFTLLNILMDMAKNDLKKQDI